MALNWIGIVFVMSGLLTLGGIWHLESAYYKDKNHPKWALLLTGFLLALFIASTYAFGEQRGICNTVAYVAAHEGTVPSALHGEISYTELTHYYPECFGLVFQLEILNEAFNSP